VRLTDLKPHWITLNGWVPTDLFAVGVSFLCPHCPVSAPEHGPNRRRRLVCRFWPPIDPGNWLPRISYPRGADTHTRVSGDTFDTLTIEPSIGYESIGHWHGRITNGAMV
jgi:hypothetical protein